MAVTIPKEEQIFVSQNVIVGLGEVVALEGTHPQAWTLPGGRTTTDYDEALEYAHNLDCAIRANTQKYNRTIL